MSYQVSFPRPFLFPVQYPVSSFEWVKKASSYFKMKALYLSMYLSHIAKLTDSWPCGNVCCKSGVGFTDVTGVSLREIYKSIYNIGKVWCSVTPELFSYIYIKLVISQSTADSTGLLTFTLLHDMYMYKYNRRPHNLHQMWTWPELFRNTLSDLRV